MYGVNTGQRRPDIVSIRRRSLDDFDRLVQEAGFIAEPAGQWVGGDDALADFITDQQDVDGQGRQRGQQGLGFGSQHVVAGGQQVAEPQRQAIHQNRPLGVDVFGQRTD